MPNTDADSIVQKVQSNAEAHALYNTAQRIAPIQSWQSL